MTHFTRMLIIGVLTALPCSASGADDKRSDSGAESATHVEVDPLEVKFQRLSTLCLRTDGHLLAGNEQARQIKVIDPSGNQVATIELEFAPESIDVADDGTIYCGGQGYVAMLGTRSLDPGPDSGIRARSVPQNGCE